MSNYDCPGIGMTQPADAPREGFVACYRAGHSCPRFVAVRSESSTHVTTSYRCPCCGQHGVTACVPKEWGDPPEPPEAIRAGIVLDGAS